MESELTAEPLSGSGLSDEKNRNRTEITDFLWRTLRCAAMPNTGQKNSSASRFIRHHVRLELTHDAPLRSDGFVCPEYSLPGTCSKITHVLLRLFICIIAVTFSIFYFYAFTTIISSDSHYHAGLTHLEILFFIRKSF